MQRTRCPELQILKRVIREGERLEVGIIFERGQVGQIIKRVILQNMVIQTRCPGAKSLKSVACEEVKFGMVGIWEIIRCCKFSRKRFFKKQVYGHGVQRRNF